MKNKGLWLSVSIFLILAVVFAFTDWQVSHALYNPTAGWANFLQAYGQLPGSFLGILCGSILISTYKVEKGIKSIAGVFGLYLLTAFASFGFFVDAFGAQMDTVQINLPIVLILTIAVLVLGQVILRRFPAEVLDEYKNAAQVGLAVMFIGAIISVWVIKIPWGRWTYRDILAAGNPELFTPWYLPQGNNGHYSFFSGHTAMAFCALGFTLFLKEGTRARNIMLVLCLLWGVSVALSRVVVGAHFASDVLVGSAEVLMWLLIFRRIYMPVVQRAEYGKVPASPAALPTNQG